VFVGKVTSPSLVGAAVSDFLLPAAEAIPATIAKLDQRALTQEAYAATLLDLTRGGLVMPTELLAIDAAWRLLNAITEVHKGNSRRRGCWRGGRRGLSGG
jgi:hypothetical protein